MKKSTKCSREQARLFRAQKLAAEKELDKQMTSVIRQAVFDLWKHMDEVEDYRKRKGTYGLDVILTVIFIGYLMGENMLKNIATVIKDNSGRVRRWMGIKYKDLPEMPSYSTMLRTVHGIDWLDVSAVFVEWIQRNFYVEKGNLHFAVDGKALRGATAKIKGHQHPTYILNVFEVNNGVIQMQLEVGNKTNELGSMPELFASISLENITITIDAAGTHGNIMSIIVSNGGHVILPVKGNQSNLEDLLEAYIQRIRTEHPDWILTFEDDDNDAYQHGRIENRQYILISRGVDDILKNTSFDGLAHSIGMVTRTVTNVKRDESGNMVDSEPSVETQIYITDYREGLSPQKFAHYVRNHWRGCETMHYILDIEFDEDRSTLRGQGKVAASFFRKAVLSLVINLKKISRTTKSCHDIRSTFRSTFAFSGSKIASESSHEQNA